MIAHIRILLPEPLHVTTAEEFSPHEFVVGEYHVTVFPPHRAKAPIGTADPLDFDERLDDSVVVDDRPSIRGDVFAVIFRAPEFARANNAAEPAVEIGIQLCNRFLRAYRIFARAQDISLIDPARAYFSLEYRADDNTALPQIDGLRRGRGRSLHPTPGVHALSRELWTLLGPAMSVEVADPAEELLLDAVALLPQAGPALVLAYTAIEVHVARALNVVATPSDFRKDRSVKRRLGRLMSVLGRADFQDSPLWERLVSLNVARNAFVHEGAITVTLAEASQLVVDVERILDWIDEALPQHARRPKVTLRDMNISATGTLIRREA